MLRFLLPLKLIFFLSFAALNLSAEDTPSCFQQLERDFFNRKNVIEALSFARVQQGVWELIANELDQSSGSIHLKLRRRAEELNPDPLEKPFNMEQSKKLLEQVLIAEMKAAFIKYDVYRESDVLVAFNFLKDRQKRKWQQCKTRQAVPQPSR